MKNRLIKIAAWAVILGYFMISLSFVREKSSEVYCRTIEVIVNDSLKNRFIVKNDILKIVTDKKYKVVGYPMSTVISRDIEEKLKNYPSIENAEAFKSADGKLRIMVEQRDPILRIINNRNESFYIDYKGSVMPLSGKYTSHVLLANGNIKDLIKIDREFKVMDSSEGIGNRPPATLIASLYYLAKYIADHELWNAQIEQLYVNNDGDIEMIPRVGAQIINLGNVEDLDEKFRKLEILYNEGFKFEGWNKYESINLKFKNQVVCKKR